MHGLTSRYVSIRVEEIDGAHNPAHQGMFRCMFSDPAAAVAFTPGTHRITLLIQPYYRYSELGSGYLPEIEVAVQAGHRYLVRMRAWTTGIPEAGMDVRVEDADTQIKICEEITIWPHA